MYELVYRVTCDKCGATADITNANTEWIGVASDGFAGAGLIGNSSFYLEAVLCPTCATEYQSYLTAIEQAKENAQVFLGKSDLSGQGSEDNPYEFQTGVECVLNAYYIHDGNLYVYMPADAEPHSYDSWEAAQNDFALWASSEAASEETVAE